MKEGESVTFETLNSVYQVVPLEDGTFKVTKTKELRESGFNAVGVPRISKSMAVKLGERAWFDDWSTSRVTKIHTEVNHGT